MLCKGHLHLACGLFSSQCIASSNQAHLGGVLYVPWQKVCVDRGAARPILHAGQVGLEDGQLCMLLLRYPRVVEYPLDHLRARLQYFTHLGLTRAQLEQVSCPVSSLRRLSYAWQRQALHYQMSCPCLRMTGASQFASSITLLVCL